VYTTTAQLFSVRTSENKTIMIITEPMFGNMFGIHVVCESAQGWQALANTHPNNRDSTLNWTHGGWDQHASQDGQQRGEAI